MTNFSLARFLLSGATVLSGFVGAQLLAADADRLVAANVVMQDEARKLPQDNTAYFSRADRRVRFELVKLSGGSGDMLAGTNITVIGPRGEESAITADADGIATLENAEPGLHAMVVAGPKGHTAVPIALREETAADVADAVESPLPPPVKLSLVDIDPKEVLRLASSYLPPKMKGSFEDTDGELVSTGQVFESPHYRVQLGDEATLDGQVYSMISSGLSTSNVEGTNILIYRGNALVARTATDQFGKFSFDEMTPGVYALVAAGTSGYACFGFEAYSVPAVAKISRGETLVSVRRNEGQLTSSVMARGTVIPVVLIPPSMVPGVFNQIRTAGQPTGSQTPVGTTPSFGTPTGGAPGGVGSGVAGGGLGGGGLGGGGLGGGLGGGIGGLGGLLAAGAIGAAVLGSDDNNNNNSFIPLPSTNGGM